MSTRALILPSGEEVTEIRLRDYRGEEVVLTASQLFGAIDALETLLCTAPQIHDDKAGSPDSTVRLFTSVRNLEWCEPHLLAVKPNVIPRRWVDQRSLRCADCGYPVHPGTRGTDFTCRCIAVEEAAEPRVAGEANERGLPVVSPELRAELVALEAQP
jgi:hypothetical protein